MNFCPMFQNTLCNPFIIYYFCRTGFIGEYRMYVIWYVLLFFLFGIVADFTDIDTVLL